MRMRISLPRPCKRSNISTSKCRKSFRAGANRLSISSMTRRVFEWLGNAKSTLNSILIIRSFHPSGNWVLGLQKTFFQSIWYSSSTFMKGEGRHSILWWLVWCEGTADWDRIWPVRLRKISVENPVHLPNWLPGTSILLWNAPKIFLFLALSQSLMTRRRSDDFPLFGGPTYQRKVASLVLMNCWYSGDSVNHSILFLSDGAALSRWWAAKV